MEKEKIYLISDASRKVQVESHVLRYWEEELRLPVKRNELGHRYYTEEDIMEFQEIKKLKEQGLQLKAIRMILRNGKLTMLPDADGLTPEDMRRMAEGTFFAEQERGKTTQEREQTTQEQGETEQSDVMPEDSNVLSREEEKMVPVTRENMLPEREAEEKAKRLEYLMKKLISEAVEESNGKFYAEFAESFTKELDYQFRMQEEREEERENRKLLLEEEHYKQLDALIRGKSSRKKREKQEKAEKKKMFGKRKKTGAV